ncbi:MAG: CvpA family protein [Burkholderiales bacterium]|nr:CvpA family protein [Burkholderiales bacterium]
MTWLDYAVGGVLAVSVAVGVWRGLVREIVSLAGWVMAFLAANLLAGPLAAHVPQQIPSPELRALAAFVAVFVATLVLASLAALLLSRLVRAAGLGGIDRALGALFGAARAAVVLAAFALLAGLTSLPRQPAWRDSASGPWLAAAALALKPWLPPAFADRLRYD